MKKLLKSFINKKKIHDVAVDLWKTEYRNESFFFVHKMVKEDYR